MITDIHTHAGNYTQLVDGGVQVEIAKLLVDMKRGNVDRSVVLPLPTAPAISDADNHNSRLLEATAPYDGLIPFCVVDLAEVDDARRQLRDAVAAGARGLKLHPIIQETSLRDERVLAVLEEASRLSIPALIHTGQFLGVGHRLSGRVGELGPLELADPLPADAIASELPDLRMILAHFGWPWSAQTLAIMQRRDNVWLDLSGWAPRHVPDDVWTQLEKRHADRFLFGTDFPMIGSERWLREFRERCKDPAVTTAVTGANAKEVLGDAG